MIISFEGIDGCGKSTQIALLTDELKRHNKKAVVLREPGGNNISEKIRELLLDNKNSSMRSETELLLYIASRTQLVRDEIRKMLEDNFIVILDRFADSTTAYQGYGRGLDLEIIGQLNHFATDMGKYMPDITFFLDIPVETAFSRMMSRGEEINRMESSDKDFFERVRNGFIIISENEPERVFRMDAIQSKEKVFEQLKKILKSRNII
ncbi:TPA: dTMP kinase [Candidatus Delongbacteria bacterium]|nr:MAG: dTMP kinase [Candidatus Delongbacteria bacterium GWF2_40_14]HAQ60945.1 dTMP kinase [Candidatus Delongbacteria bacterium]